MPDEIEQPAAPDPALDGGMSPVLKGFLVLGGLTALVLLGIIIANLIRLGMIPGTEPVADGSRAGDAPAALVQEDVVPGAVAVDFTVSTLDGTAVRLSDYRGRNPVWLNFWASWCGPCKQEMPAMEELYQQHKPRGLVILGFDYNEEPATVQNYLSSQSFHWLFVTAPTQQTIRRYYVNMVPTHIFIDRAGVIRGRIAGSLSRAMMETQLKLILD
jgi:thiol-disulfide isomerase/thioredoxin